MDRAAITYRKIKSLKFADYNPRGVTSKEADEIRTSLVKFGFVGAVIVNQHPKRKDVIVGGHARCTIWAELGNTEVPCIYVKLTEEQERELNLRLNHAQGHWEFEKLVANFDADVLIDVGFENLSFVDDDTKGNRQGHDEPENEDEDEPTTDRRKFETGRTHKVAEDTVLISVGTDKCRVSRKYYDQWKANQDRALAGSTRMARVLDLLGFPPESIPE